MRINVFQVTEARLQGDGGHLCALVYQKEDVKGVGRYINFSGYFTSKVLFKTIV